MPLNSPDDEQCKEIIKVLCAQPDAFLTGFRCYLKFYCHICSRHDGYSAHEDILQAVTFLRKNMNSTRSIFQNRAFEPFGTSIEQQENCTRTAVQLAFMVDCSLRDRYSTRYRLSNTLGRWEGHQRFIEFLERCFPTTTAICEKDWRTHLTAWQLKKRFKVNFIAVDDLTQHLVYDSHSNTVRIFHQTAWLKSQLRQDWDKNLADGFQHCMQSGTLPARLVLETLVTIYYILFPSSDDQWSAGLAKSLIEKWKFDPDFTNDDLRRKLTLDRSVLTVDGFECIYWAARLRDLENIAEKPPASNRFINWVDWHTSDRNALTIAILGLFLAALFGLIGCLLGVAQLVVAILAWKYPVPIA